MGFKDELKKSWNEAGEKEKAKKEQEAAEALRLATPQERRFVYKVVEVRSSLIGDKQSGEGLEKLLNEHAKEGWQLRALTSVDVKGRIGPGGTDGLLITLERPY